MGASRAKIGCRPLCWVAVTLAVTVGLRAQPPRQTQADDYTRYELLEPESQSFRIYYDVTATAAGAEYYYNTIRIGSEPTVHGVYDRMSGNELEWKIVGGDVAKKGGVEAASPEGKYIQIRLARPVPNGGEARIRIDKTYKDPESYYLEEERLVFSRSLGIKRNAVVLPAGYELVECNYPSQVMTEPDGRIKVSFMNPGPGAVPYVVRAKRLPAKRRGTSSSSTAKRVRTNPGPAGDSTAPPPQPSSARLDDEFSERAYQDREIVYFLKQPETQSFRLYHDYTESREGVDRYLNVVRAGSKVSNPSAQILDTGEPLRVETLKGKAIRERGIDIGREITKDTEVVVIGFDPVKKGGSIRLRIEETYTDPNCYLLAGDELVWDRSFGRPRNTVVLPDGWYLTTSSIPAVVSATDDGRIQLDFVNDRPDSIDVVIKARRRSGL